MREFAVAQQVLCLTEILRQPAVGIADMAGDLNRQTRIGRNFRNGQFRAGKHGTAERTVAPRGGEQQTDVERHRRHDRTHIRKKAPPHPTGYRKPRCRKNLCDGVLVRAYFAAEARAERARQHSITLLSRQSSVNGKILTPGSADTPKSYLCRYLPICLFIHLDKDRRIAGTGARQLRGSPQAASFISIQSDNAARCAALKNSPCFVRLTRTSSPVRAHSCSINQRTSHSYK